MAEKTQLACNCRNVQLEVEGAPFLVSECLCNSCRTAASRLAHLPGIPQMLTPYGATGCAEYRKDRVAILQGHAHLKDFYLSDGASTRRVIATCCNTPIFMEMKGAHWLSLYLQLWPKGTRPAAQLRTMLGDMQDISNIPNDVPNLKTHSVKFYAKLLVARIAMGFHTPRFETGGQLDV